MMQLADVDQSLDGDEYDGGQHRIGQRAEKAGEEQKDAGDRRRGDDQRKGRAGAAPLINGRLGEAAGDWIALKQAGEQAGGAEAQQLLARTNVVAVLEGKSSGGSDAHD